MFKSLKKIFPVDDWDSSPESVTSEANWLSKLRESAKVKLGNMPQISISGLTLTIKQIQHYYFGDVSFASYVLYDNNKAQCQLIVASQNDDDNYLAISRHLTEDELYRMCSHEDVRLLTQPRQLKRLYVRENAQGLEGWISMRYNKKIDSVSGKKTINGRSASFDYTLLVSEDNSKAIEVERYQDGRCEIYTTVYRPVDDIIDISGGVSFVSRKSFKQPREHEHIVSVPEPDLSNSFSNIQINDIAPTLETVPEPNFTNEEKEEADLKPKSKNIIENNEIDWKADDNNITSKDSNAPKAEKPTINKENQISKKPIKEIKTIKHNIKNPIQDTEKEINTKKTLYANENKKLEKQIQSKLREVAREMTRDEDYQKIKKPEKKTPVIKHENSKEADKKQSSKPVIPQKTKNKNSSSLALEDIKREIEQKIEEEIQRELRKKNGLGPSLAKEALSAGNNDNKASETTATVDMVSPAAVPIKPAAKKDKPNNIADTSKPDAAPAKANQQSSLIRRAEKENISCNIHVASKIIDEAIKSDIHLADVMRSILGLPININDEVMFTLPLSDEDYRILGKKYGIAAEKREEIRVRMMKDFHNFAGKNIYSKGMKTDA